MYLHGLSKFLLCMILLVLAFRWSHYAQAINSQSIFTKIFLLLIAMGILYLSLCTSRNNDRVDSNLNVRREYVTPDPIKRHQSVECFNTESFVTMKPLKTPYLQLPSGGCYELEDLEHMLRSRRTLLNDQPISENEEKCAAHFLVNANVESPHCKEIGGRMHSP